MDRSHLIGPPTAMCSFVARNRSATSWSICEIGNIWPLSGYNLHWNLSLRPVDPVRKALLLRPRCYHEPPLPHDPPALSRASTKKRGIVARASCQAVVRKRGLQSYSHVLSAQQVTSTPVARPSCHKPSLELGARLDNSWKCLVVWMISKLANQRSWFTWVLNWLILPMECSCVAESLWPFYVCPLGVDPVVNSWRPGVHKPGVHNCGKPLHASCSRKYSSDGSVNHQDAERTHCCDTGVNAKACA